MWGQIFKELIWNIMPVRAPFNIETLHYTPSNYLSLYLCWPGDESQYSSLRKVTPYVLEYVSSCFVISYSIGIPIWIGRRTAEQQKFQFLYLILWIHFKTNFTSKTMSALKPLTQTVFFSQPEYTWQCWHRRPRRQKWQPESIVSTERELVAGQPTAPDKWAL